MDLVYDTEGDGFREETTRLWCVVAKDMNSGEIYKYRPDEIHKVMDLFSQAKMLVCHNQISHDLPILKKLYGWEPNEDTLIVDTLVMSRLLWPDRPLPKGFSGKDGPHSVAAWGYRIGRYKPEHEDWTQFSEEMLHRCVEDVEIQERIYELLLLEAKR